MLNFHVTVDERQREASSSIRGETFRGRSLGKEKRGNRRDFLVDADSEEADAKWKGSFAVCSRGTRRGKRETRAPRSVFWCTCASSRVVILVAGRSRNDADISRAFVLLTHLLFPDSTAQIRFLPSRTRRYDRLDPPNDPLFTLVWALGCTICGDWGISNFEAFGLRCVALGSLKNVNEAWDWEEDKMRLGQGLSWCRDHRLR